MSIRELIEDYFTVEERHDPENKGRFDEVDFGFYLFKKLRVRPRERFSERTGWTLEYMVV